ncbi:UvrD-helicase domain-containing protein, partial [Acinetobacter baumannii]
GMGEWVRYKLDQATEHVLIDEAQDTNPDQWAIIRALVEEFFVGEGSHGERVRTLFTVGDFKQAIFGFQGTDPKFFAAA